MTLCKNCPTVSTGWIFPNLEIFLPNLPNSQKIFVWKSKIIGHFWIAKVFWTDIEQEILRILYFWILSLLLPFWVAKYIKFEITENFEILYKNSLSIGHCGPKSPFYVHFFISRQHDREHVLTVFMYIPSLLYKKLSYWAKLD